MRIDWWTLALQTVNVVILIWLLSRFLYRPVTAAISARQAAAQKLTSEAEDAKRRAEAQEEALRRRSDALEAEKAQVLSQARTEAEAERAAMLKAAADEAAKARAAAQVALGRDREAARRALERDAAKLAVEIAGRLVARMPADGAAEALFQELLEHVRALPEVEQRRLGGPVDLVCAQPVSDAAQGRFRSELAAVVSQVSSIALRVDPDLIAGFEIRSPNMVVSNSWRSDLERISHELAPSDAA